MFLAILRVTAFDAHVVSLVPNVKLFLAREIWCIAFVLLAGNQVVFLSWYACGLLVREQANHKQTKIPRKQEKADVNTVCCNSKSLSEGLSTIYMGKTFHLLCTVGGSLLVAQPCTAPCVCVACICHCRPLVMSKLARECLAPLHGIYIC